MQNPPCVEGEIRFGVEMSGGENIEGLGSQAAREPGTRF